MWTCQDEDADFYDAMYVAWGDYPESYEKYESRVDELCLRYGSNPDERAWQVDWYDELYPLWAAMREVAEMLVDSQSVTHDLVQAAVDRRRSD